MNLIYKKKSSMTYHHYTKKAHGAPLSGVPQNAQMPQLQNKSTGHRPRSNPISDPH